MINVLLIEDEPTILNSYTFGLTKNGLQVTPAENAKAALELIKKHTYDIILVDLLMPELSGLDFLKIANLRESMPNAKVIILSNTESAKIKDQAKELGSFEYLLKIDNTPSQLAETIKAIVKG